MGNCSDAHDHGWGSRSWNMPLLPCMIAILLIIRWNLLELTAFGKSYQWSTLPGTMKPLWYLSQWDNPPEIPGNRGVDFPTGLPHFYQQSNLQKMRWYFEWDYAAFVEMGKFKKVGAFVTGSDLDNLLVFYIHFRPFQAGPSLQKIQDSENLAKFLSSYLSQQGSLQLRSTEKSSNSQLPYIYIYIIV